MAGRLQHNESLVTRIVALVAVVSAGCFYTDPINQRPSADIIQTSAGPVYRSSSVTLEADTSDPEHQSVHVQWRAYACTDGTLPDGCDQDPFYTELADTASFDVPNLRADGTPVESVLVILEATDSEGATAKPDQQLVITVSDHPPIVKTRTVSSYDYVVGMPMVMYAAVTDPDDPPPPPQNVTWQVTAPDGSSFGPLGDLPPQLDGVTLNVGKTVTPDAIGLWNFQVTATDVENTPGGGPGSFQVVADHPPCIEQVSPITPPAGDALPVTQPTLFDVLVVADDLDPYPPEQGDPLRGTTTFSWSLEPPGASSFGSLGVTASSVAFDPSSYTPGDLVELRVEIYDRNHTQITCDPSDATCSVISDPTCVQRLTWTVEVE